MYRHLFRSAIAKNSVAGAAVLVAGSAYFSGFEKQEQRESIMTHCEKLKSSDDASTVLGLLREVSAAVRRLEATLGSKGPLSNSSNTKHGIDVVLGAQWGDEGKGKLVDILSQVSTVQSAVFDETAARALVLRILNLNTVSGCRNTTSALVSQEDQMQAILSWWTISNTNFTCFQAGS